MTVMPAFVHHRGCCVIYKYEEVQDNERRQSKRVMQSQDTRDARSPAISPFYAEVQHLAEENHLGAPQVEYTQTTINGTRLLINAVVWFVIALIGFYFVINALLQIRYVYTDTESLQSMGAMAIVGAILLGGCLLQSWRNLREYQYRKREQIHVFEDGFVYLEGRDKSYVLRWDHIDALLRGVLDPKRTGHILRDRLTIVTDKDEVFALNPKLQQRTEICDLIERLYTDYRLPGMLELYKLGEDLEFGDLILNRRGVSRFEKNSEDEETIEWDEVSTINVSDQFTCVYTKDDPDGKPWFDRVTLDVENALILKELVPKVIEIGS
jgi:hypothetical protein